MLGRRDISTGIAMIFFGGATFSVIASSRPDSGGGVVAEICRHPRFGWGVVGDFFRVSAPAVSRIMGGALGEKNFNKYGPSYIWGTYF